MSTTPHKRPHCHRLKRIAALVAGVFSAVVIVVMITSTVHIIRDLQTALQRLMNSTESQGYEYYLNPYKTENNSQNPFPHAQTPRQSEPESKSYPDIQTPSPQTESPQTNREVSLTPFELLWIEFASLATTLENQIPLVRLQKATPEVARYVQSLVDADAKLIDVLKRNFAIARQTLSVGTSENQDAQALAADIEDLVNQVTQQIQAAKNDLYELELSTNASRQERTALERAKDQLIIRWNAIQQEFEALVLGDGELAFYMSLDHDSLNSLYKCLLSCNQALAPTAESRSS